MIYFKNIFERAFNLLDDPDLSRYYYEDQAEFQRVMLGYLITGKQFFTSPVAIAEKLVQVDESCGVSESDIGDGGTDYVLIEDIPNNGVGVGFTFIINGEKVLGSYIGNNTVRFSREVLESDNWEVSWFYAGAFTADFSGIFRSDFSMDYIIDKITTILAYATISAYGQKEVNRILDIRNGLTDTDFKVYSPANSVKEKTAWHNQINANMDTLVSELNWMILSTPRGGSRFGK